MNTSDSKILALLQQQLAETMRTNSLLTMVQVTLEAQAALLIDIMPATSGPRAKVISDFEERRSAMFDELKKKSIEDRQRLLDALGEVLYGAGRDESTPTQPTNVAGRPNE